MDEKEASLGFEPFRNLFEKFFVVFHMFKHFVGQNSIEHSCLKTICYIQVVPCAGLILVADWPKY